MKKLFSIMLIANLILIGCQMQNQDHSDSDDQEESSVVSVTQWTETMEIFMEYENAIPGQETKFIIHLTTLNDFQPVRDGKVVLSFLGPSGQERVIEEDQLLREGIFTPLVTFDRSAEYEFTILYKNDRMAETFSIGRFTVYPSIDDIAESEDKSVGEEITFLKEQQWKVEFATEETQLRVVKSAVHAVGEIKQRPASYAEIISPVEGILSIANASQLVKPGQKIRRGQTMAVIRPPLTTQNSWVDFYHKYEQAKIEYERAQRLKERNAISQRDFEQAQRNYNINKSSFSYYFDSDNGSLSFDSKDQQFRITAPINGILADVTVLPGEKLDRGQKLFSIVDPSIVWLKLELFTNQISKLKDISGVSIKIPGNTDVINLDQFDLKLISRGEIIDPVKQTIDILLEVKNNDRQFIIGQTFNAQIYTGQATPMLTVPASAVFDDNAQKVIYVHTSGESFEKREIVIGASYHDYIAIVSGLESGERVVSSGGYMVKLASTSETIGHAHTH